MKVHIQAAFCANTVEQLVYMCHMYVDKIMVSMGSIGLRHY